MNKKKEKNEKIKESSTLMIDEKKLKQKMSADQYDSSNKPPEKKASKKISTDSDDDDRDRGSSTSFIDNEEGVNEKNEGKSLKSKKQMADALRMTERDSFDGKTKLDISQICKEQSSFIFSIFFIK